MKEIKNKHIILLCLLISLWIASIFILKITEWLTLGLGFAAAYLGYLTYNNTKDTTKILNQVYKLQSKTDKREESLEIDSKPYIYHFRSWEI